MFAPVPPTTAGPGGEVTELGLFSTVQHHPPVLTLVAQTVRRIQVWSLGAWREAGPGPPHLLVINRTLSMLGTLVD